MTTHQEAQRAAPNDQGNELCQCSQWVVTYGHALQRGEFHHRDCRKWHRVIGSAIVTKTEFMVIGDPRDDDESHNCDAMGCSTVSHVLVRMPLEQLGIEQSAKAAVPLTPDAILDLAECMRPTLHSADDWGLARTFARAVIAKFCEVNGITTATHPEASKQEAVPEGYRLVMVPDLAPGDEPDWDECLRQCEVATGIKVERHTLSIFIREVRRWIASKQEAQGWQVAASTTEAVRHSANEWADLAYNGIQWLHNIVDGISTPADALENMLKCEPHCRQVNDVAMALLAATPKPQADPRPLTADERGVMTRAAKASGRLIATGAQPQAEPMGGPGSSSYEQICNALDGAHDLGGPAHERIKKLIEQRATPQELAARSAQTQAEPAPSAAAKVEAVLVVAKSDLAKLKASDQYIRAWLPPAMGASEMELFAAHPTPDAAQADALDAARWRHVREHSYVEVKCISPRYYGWKPEHLDERVDAALAAQKGGAA